MRFEEKNALRISLFLFLLALGSLWYCAKILDIKLDSWSSLVMLVPLLAYVVFSGKLKSVKYGSFEAVLHDTVSSLPLARHDAVVFERSATIEKQTIEDLNRQLRLLRGYRPLFLELEMKKKEYYVAEVLRQYVDALVKDSRFAGITIVDHYGNFVGFFDRIQVDRFRSTEILIELIRQIENEDIRGLQHLGISTSSVFKNERLVDVVRGMLDEGIFIKVVVDENQAPVGLVEFTEAVRRMVSQIDSAENVEIFGEPSVKR